MLKFLKPTTLCVTKCQYFTSNFEILLGWRIQSNVFLSESISMLCSFTSISETMQKIRNPPGRNSSVGWFPLFFYCQLIDARSSYTKSTRKIVFHKELAFSYKLKQILDPQLTLLNCLRKQENFQNNVCKSCMIHRPTTPKPNFREEETLRCYGRATWQVDKFLLRNYWTVTASNVKGDLTKWKSLRFTK